MCIALPMKVLDINGNVARVEFSGNEISINISLISPNVGDYVLVHAGCAIEIVKKETADEIFDILEELEEASR